MSLVCMICAGASGKPLAGKRCTANRCKDEYAKRLKLQKAGGEPAELAGVGALGGVRGAQVSKISPSNLSSG